MDKKNYILRCPTCSGSRSVYKANGRRVACPACKGIGEVTYSKDLLMYKVMDLNRKININWEALQHKRAVPKRFFVNASFDCPECFGEKKIREERCPVCKGTGYSPLTLRKVFRHVFNSFSVLKTQRDELNEMIEEKVWKKPHASTLTRLKPDKPQVVCTRCTHYLNENKNNPCEECSNFTRTGRVFQFRPITSDADRWYRAEGYKWNHKEKRR